jgi:hypothetical protein
MQPVRCITTQIRGIQDDRGGNARGPVPILPPVFDELALIDHMVCQAPPDKGKVPVSVNGANAVAQSRPVDAVDPIDPVQALYDPDPAPPRISELEHVTRPGKDEERIRSFRRVVGNFQAAGTKSLLEFQPERSDTARALDARNDANAIHTAIIVFIRAERRDEPQSKRENQTDFPEQVLCPNSAPLTPVGCSPGSAKVWLN